MSLSGGPWPKHNKRGSSSAKRRIECRFSATSVQKKPGGSCSPGHVVAMFIPFRTSPTMAT